MCFIDLNGINNYWKYFKINYDDDIVGFHNKLQIFLDGLKDDSYILAPCLYMEAERSFIQLGPHFILDKDMDVNILGDILIIRLEEKIMLNYQIIEGDILLLKHSLLSSKGIKNLKKIKKPEIGTYHRRLFTNMKSSYLSTKIFPMEMENEYYGEEVKILDAKENNSRAFLYNKKYVIIREKENLNETKNNIVIKSSVYAIRSKYCISPYQMKDLYKLLEYKDRANLDGHERELINLKLFYDKETKLIKMEGKYPNISFVKPKKKDIFIKDKIITIDLETYKDVSKMELFAIGIYDGVVTKKYLLEENESTELLVKKAFEDLMIKKYNGYTVYMHNLAGFDCIFLLKILKKIGYQVDTLFKENKQLLWMKISVTQEKNETAFFRRHEKSRGNGHIERKQDEEYNIPLDNGLFKDEDAQVNKKERISIIMKDSYQILPKSLEKLTEVYNTNTKKSFFPHEWLIKENRFYKGEIPNRIYWNDNITDKFWNTQNKKKWDLRKELLIYMENDLKGLYEVLKKFITRIYQLYKVNVVKFSTIASLSVGIYLTFFYDKTNDYKKGLRIPIIHGVMYKHIRSSYIGGIVEVYKPKAENTNYVDVNSMYPWALTQKLPLGKPIYTTEKNLDKIFGFVGATVTCPEFHNIPPLCFRDENGRIFNPIGTWTAWFFTEELKDVRDNYGYTIDIHEGYHFEQSTDIFRDFVQHFFNKKCDWTDPEMQLISKLILNSFYGKWGSKEYILRTKILSNEDVDQIARYLRIHDIQDFDENHNLVTYDINPDYDLCEQNAIDYIKELTKLEGSYKNTYTSIPIASATTAISRIHINKFTHIKGNPPIYIDTDGLELTNPLPEHLIGDGLGQMKLEAIIKRSISIAPKLRWHQTLNDEIVQKVKGLGPLLTEMDFEKLYQGETVIKEKEYWVPNLSESNIEIIKRSIHITGNLTKRRKLYSNGLWVATEPLRINQKLLLEPLSKTPKT